MPEGIPSYVFVLYEYRDPPRSVISYDFPPHNPKEGSTLGGETRVVTSAAGRWQRPSLAMVRSRMKEQRLPDSSVVESTCHVGDQFTVLVGKISWRR